MTIQEFPFTDKKLMDNCMKRFCYYHENGNIGSKIYEGYNFPVSVIKNFSILTTEEKWLKDNITKETIYIIGFMKNNRDVREHERRHAIFYTNSNIENYTKKIWTMLPEKVKNDIGKQFSRLGYNKKVWLDELYAYLYDKAFWSRKNYNILRNIILTLK
jgi:hypothetical protein